MRHPLNPRQRLQPLLEPGGPVSNASHKISVPHLGNSAISYALAQPYDQARPTLVLINSFTTSVALYRAQFANAKLGDVANLLAIEPYGHGGTDATYRHFTYWDSAIANLQVLQALGIGEAFVLGTSQGGWIAARMAMLAPDVIKGIIPLGTSMDYESERSRDLGCWDGAGILHSVDRRSRRASRRRLGRSHRVRRRSPGIRTRHHRHPTDCASSGTPSTSETTPATKAVTGCESPRSTCATATACTRDWTASTAQCCGCTAPPTRCTQSPTPRRRSLCSPTPLVPNCGSSNAVSTS